MKGTRNSYWIRPYLLGWGWATWPWGRLTQSCRGWKAPKQFESWDRTHDAWRDFLEDLPKNTTASHRAGGMLGRVGWLASHDSRHEDSMVISTCSSLMECLLTCYLPVPWITRKNAPRGDNPRFFMKTNPTNFQSSHKQWIISWIGKYISYIFEWRWDGDSLTFVGELPNRLVGSAILLEPFTSCCWAFIDRFQMTIFPPPKCSEGRKKVRVEHWRAEKMWVSMIKTLFFYKNDTHTQTHTHTHNGDSF